MPVTTPIAGVFVEFDIAHPKGAADVYLSVEEIRPGVTVGQTWVDDIHGLAVRCLKRSKRIEAVLPDVV